MASLEELLAMEFEDTTEESPTIESGQTETEPTVESLMSMEFEDTPQVDLVEAPQQESVVEPQVEVQAIEIPELGFLDNRELNSTVQQLNSDLSTIELDTASTRLKRLAKATVENGGDPTAINDILASLPERKEQRKQQGLETGEIDNISDFGQESLLTNEEQLRFSFLPQDKQAEVLQNKFPDGSPILDKFGNMGVIKDGTVYPFNPEGADVGDIYRSAPVATEIAAGLTAGLVVGTMVAPPTILGISLMAAADALGGQSARAAVRKWMQTEYQDMNEVDRSTFNEMMVEQSPQGFMDLATNLIGGMAWKTITRGASPVLGTMNGLRGKLINQHISRIQKDTGVKIEMSPGVITGFRPFLRAEAFFSLLPGGGKAKKLIDITKGSFTEAAGKIINKEPIPDSISIGKDSIDTITNEFTKSSVKTNQVIKDTLNEALTDIKQIPSKMSSSDKVANSDYAVITKESAGNRKDSIAGLRSAQYEAANKELGDVQPTLNLGGIIKDLNKSIKTEFLSATKELQKEIKTKTTVTTNDAVATEKMLKGSEKRTARKLEGETTEVAIKPESGSVTVTDKVKEITTKGKSEIDDLLFVTNELKSTLKSFEQLDGAIPLNKAINLKNQLWDASQKVGISEKPFIMKINKALMDEITNLRTKNPKYNKLKEEADKTFKYEQNVIKNPKYSYLYKPSNEKGGVTNQELGTRLNSPEAVNYLKTVLTPDNFDLTKASKLNGLIKGSVIKQVEGKLVVDVKKTLTKLDKMAENGTGVAWFGSDFNKIHREFQIMNTGNRLRNLQLTDTVFEGEASVALDAIKTAHKAQLKLDKEYSDGILGAVIKGDLTESAIEPERFVDLLGTMSVRELEDFHKLPQIGGRVKREIATSFMEDFLIRASDHLSASESAALGLPFKENTVITRAKFTDALKSLDKNPKTAKIKLDLILGGTKGSGRSSTLDSLVFLSDVEAGSRKSVGDPGRIKAATLSARMFDFLSGSFTNTVVKPLFHNALMAEVLSNKAFKAWVTRSGNPVTATQNMMAFYATRAGQEQINDMTKEKRQAMEQWLAELQVNFGD